MYYTYKLFTPDGDQAGDAHYAVLIEPGEIIHTGDGRKLKVLSLVPIESEDELYGDTGFLMVEAA